MALHRLFQSRSFKASSDIQPSAVLNTPPGAPPGFIVPPSRWQAISRIDCSAVAACIRLASM